MTRLSDIKIQDPTSEIHYTLPEHRKAYADDFGGESDALSLRKTVCRTKDPKKYSHIAWSDLCVAMPISSLVKTGYFHAPLVNIYVKQTRVTANTLLS